MFSPFSTFPLPNVRTEPGSDHLMDWVGWRGAGFIALIPVDEALMMEEPEQADEEDQDRPVRLKPKRH